MGVRMVVKKTAKGKNPKYAVENKIRIVRVPSSGNRIVYRVTQERALRKTGATETADV